MPGRILVQSIVSKEEKTNSGIILAATDAPDNKAKVVKASEGSESLEGKVISYRDEAGRPVRVQGRDYLLMYEPDIDGIYE